MMDAALSMLTSLNVQFNQTQVLTWEKQLSQHIYMMILKNFLVKMDIPSNILFIESNIIEIGVQSKKLCTF